MELSQKEKQEIAEMAADILTKRSQPKICHGWLALRKEIESYCRENSRNTRWPTVQSKIYDAIRVVLDIGRIDSMSVDQVKEARKVFDFIKQEREKALWNS
jgi:hypothetical protein